MSRYFELKHTATRLGIDLVEKAGEPLLQRAISAFLRVTNPVASLWAVRYLAWGALFLSVLLSLFFHDLFMHCLRQQPVFFVALTAVIPFELFWVVSVHKSEATGKTQDGVLWGVRHAEHAVHAQNGGAIAGPFFAFAVIVAQLKQLSVLAGKGAAPATSASVVGLVLMEVLPAVAVLISLRCMSPVTRRRHWPGASVAVHVVRMLLCVFRMHHNYHMRRQLLKGMMLNIASSVLAVGWFPMWASTDVMCTQVGLVLCDWLGHYWGTGTAPAFLAGGGTSITPGEFWGVVLAEVLWRMLMPAAVNAYVMHVLLGKPANTPPNPVKGSKGVSAGKGSLAGKKQSRRRDL